MASKKPAKKAKSPVKSGAKKILNKAAKQVVKKPSAALNNKGSKPTKGKPVKAAPAAKVVAKKKVAAPAAPQKSIKAPSVTKGAPVKAVKGAKAPIAPAVVAAKNLKKDLKPAKAKKGEPVIEVEVSAFKLKGKEVKGKKAGTQLTKSAREAKKRCREPGCENDPLLGGYCRLHYIKNWRKIKRKEAILATGQLNNYVEELVSKYPDKYLDVIRQDLASEKDWAKVVVDLELDHAEDENSAEEEAEAVTEGGVRRDRDFDDDSDTF